MPINEPEQMPFNSLLADIFTANAKQSEWATNQVFANKDREIAELQRAYVLFWEQIDEANQTVDSLKIDAILAKHGMRVSRADNALRNPAN
jgi:hypothetical protein